MKIVLPLTQYEADRLLDNLLYGQPVQTGADQRIIRKLRELGAKEKP